LTTLKFQAAFPALIFIYRHDSNPPCVFQIYGLLYQALEEPTIFRKAFTIGLFSHIYLFYHFDRWKEIEGRTVVPTKNRHCGFACTDDSVAKNNFPMEDT
jgi:hypothetical protein